MRYNVSPAKEGQPGIPANFSIWLTAADINELRTLIRIKLGWVGWVLNERRG